MPTIFPAKFELSALNGNNGFVINGVSAGDYSGYSVSAAGDVNGDGRVDILIGAPVFSTSYVIFGNTAIGSGGVLELSSLNSTNGFAIHGITAYDNGGQSVSSAGDMNGDGFADILIGAPLTSPGGRSWAGTSYVIFGSTTVGSGGVLELSSLNGSNGFAINGVAADDYSGSSVSTAGDVNGDGFADILIGAFYASPGGRSHAGASYVIFGGPTVGSGGILELSNLNGSNGFVINGVSPNNNSGYSVSSVGDVNGDGKADIIIGAPQANTSTGLHAGISYIIFGSTTVGSGGVLELSSLNGSNGFAIDGVSQPDLSGSSVSAAGDVNGDGIADILIGAYNANYERGITYVIFGSTTVGSGGVLGLSSLNGSNGFKINGINQGGRSGWSVSAAGDMNGDGKADILIGALSSEGIGYIIFGNTTIGSGGVLGLSSLNGTNGFAIKEVSPNDRAGWSVSLAGDVNGDGNADILIGAYQASPGGRDSAGASYVIFGDETPQLLTNNLSITAGGSQLLDSNQLSAMTNRHNNNTLLFTVSNIQHGQFELTTNPGTNITSFTQQQITSGQVKFVHDGSTLAPSYAVVARTGIEMAILPPPQQSNITFSIISSLLTTRGLATTSSITSSAPSTTIAAATTSSSTSSASSTTTAVATTSSSNSSVPSTTTTVATTSSSNSSAPSTTTAVTTTSIPSVTTTVLPTTISSITSSVPSATTTALTTTSSIAPSVPPTTTALTTTPPITSSTPSATTIAVATTSSITSPVPSARTFPASIELSTLNGHNGFAINGVSTDDQSGYSVSAAGDVNGDGRVDIFIGSPFCGTSYIIFGDTTMGSGQVFELSSLNGTNGFAINGVPAYSTSNSISTAGDMNGDGFADILVGFPFANPDGRGNSGTSYVIFGGPTVGSGGVLELSSLNGSNGFAINGAFGPASVSTAGDLNGDGFADILIGAPHTSPGGNGNSGTSYVIFGGRTVGSGGVLTFSLHSGNGFAINGVSSGDQNGYAVSAAGDVNGDGFADILIGAPYASPGGRSIAGTSYVIFGGTTVGSSDVLELSSLNGSNGFAINGIAANDFSGNSVSTAGDMNGDGFADILIGAYQASPGGRFFAGSSYVIFGGTTVGSGGILELSRLNGTNGFAINGVARSDLSGYSVSAAGDINDDGNADIIIGAPGTHNYIGTSYVIFGGRTVGNGGVLELSSLNGSNGFAINGIAVRDWSGSSVSAANDLNGDGKTDILIGAFLASPGERANAGISYVIFSGNITSPITSSIPSVTATAVATTSPIAPPVPSLATIFPANIELAALNGHNGFAINGITSGDYIGSSVSTAGDVNGDGFADILIGGPNNGTSYIIFGGTSVSSGEIFELSSLNGSNGFAIKGVYKSSCSVSAAGDVNGDGFSDILIGVAGANPSGRSIAGTSYVIFGGPMVGSTGILELSSLNGSNGFAMNGIAAYDWSGYSVSTAGDVNGDGKVDILIGAPYASPGGRHQAGISYVIFGGTTVGNGGVLELSSLNGTNGFAINGLTANDQSGYSVRAAGDMNKDGKADILIGSPGASPGGRQQAGISYVIFGGTAVGSGGVLELSSLNGTNGFAIKGVAANDWSGWSVSAAGDVNGDGNADILIGTTGPGPRNYAGTSYIIFGGTTVGSSGALELSSLNGSNGFTMNGVTAYDASSGGSVSAAGDMNGDGFADIIIGAPYVSPGGCQRAGISYVIFGNTTVGSGSVLELSSLKGSNGFAMNGLAAGDASGYSVSAAGDVNGDGNADILIGAPFAGPDGRSYAGTSYIVFGDETPQLLTNSLSITAGGSQLLNASQLSAITNYHNNNTLLFTLSDIQHGQFELTTNPGTPITSFIQQQITDGQIKFVHDGSISAPSYAVVASTGIGNALLPPPQQSKITFSISSSISSATTALTTTSSNTSSVLSATTTAVATTFSSNSSAPATTTAIATTSTSNSSAPSTTTAVTKTSSSNSFALSTTTAVAKSSSITSSAPLTTTAVTKTSSSNSSALSTTTAVAKSSSITSSTPSTTTAITTTFSSNSSVSSKITAIATTSSSNSSVPSPSITPLVPTVTTFPASINLSGLNGRNGFAINGVASGDYSGYSVSAAGDVNGDGFADILIGARNASPGGRGSAGISYVIFGSTMVGSNGIRELSSLNGSNGFAIKGVANIDYSGNSVSAAGDVNGDGFADILIGSYQSVSPGDLARAGASYIIFGGTTVGSSGALELSSLNGNNGFTINGVASGDHSGSSVSAAGDVNGDGFADILIGAPDSIPDGLTRSGSSYVVFGGTAVGSGGTLELSSLNGSNGFAIYGVDRLGQSGNSVSTAGDVNGDGFADILIGAPKANPGERSTAGTSYIIFGGTTVGSDGVLELSSLNGSNGFAIYGVTASSWSGYSVSAAGDVNGDGFADILIGAYLANPKGIYRAGASYVVFGGTNVGSGGVLELSSLNGSNGFAINGITASNESGKSVSTAGDVNGDGFADILIGGPGASPSGRTSAGASYVVFGGTSVGSGGVLELSSLNGSNGFAMNGVTAYDISGFSVRAAGDVNGDGNADILIGAYTADPGGRDQAGTSYLVFGDETPQLLTNSLSIIKGGSQLLNASQLSAMTYRHNNNTLVFTLSSIQHGRFELTTKPGTPITSFIQQQITDGQVKFVHDGSTSAPSYAVVVSTGIGTALLASPQQSKITFSLSSLLPSVTTTAVAKTSSSTSSVLSATTTAVVKTSSSTSFVPSITTTAVATTSSTTSSAPSITTTALATTSSSTSSAPSIMTTAVATTSSTTSSAPSITTTALATTSSTAAGSSTDFANSGSSAMIGLIVGLLGGALGLIGLTVALYYRNRRNKSHATPSINESGITLPMQENPVHASSSASTSQSGHSDDVQKTASYSSVGRNSLLHDTSVMAKGKTPAVVTFLSPEEKNDLQVLKQYLQRILTSDAGMLLPESLLFSAGQSENRIKQVAVLIQTWLAAEALKSVSLAQAGGKEFSEQDNSAQKNFEAIRAAIQNLIELVDKQAPDDAKPSVEAQATPETEQSSRTQEHVNELRHLLTMVQSVCDILEGRRIRLLQPRLKS